MKNFTLILLVAGSISIQTFAMQQPAQNREDKPTFQVADFKEATLIASHLCQGYDTNRWVGILAGGACISSDFIFSDETRAAVYRIVSGPYAGKIYGARKGKGNWSETGEEKLAEDADQIFQRLEEWLDDKIRHRLERLDGLASQKAIIERITSVSR